MQTFLPYPDFKESAKCLDNKRLNKQIVEAMQIFTVNSYFDLGIKAGWQNHPAVKMWRGFGSALLLYRNDCIDEWRSRGYNSHSKVTIGDMWLKDVVYPFWLGDTKFHQAHQSNLVRKLPEHYRKYFLDVPDNLPYIWPV
jgi:hypothetical protein